MATPSRVVCVDASLALAVVLEEEHSEWARSCMARWTREGTARVAPSLFAWETRSVLRNKVWRKVIDVREGKAALERLDLLGVALSHGEDLPPLAWTLAVEHGLPTVYDAAYLALAQSLGCDLWTVDETVAKSVKLRDVAIRVPG